MKVPGSWRISVYFEEFEEPQDEKNGLIGKNGLRRTPTLVRILVHRKFRKFTRIRHAKCIYCQHRLEQSGHACCHGVESGPCLTKKVAPCRSGFLPGQGSTRMPEKIFFFLTAANLVVHYSEVFFLRGATMKSRARFSANLIRTQPAFAIWFAVSHLQCKLSKVYALPLYE
jgi:hypothetical protein